MELLTVQEFAERMKISRTTVFDWIRKGTLRLGRHYLKIGRVIRFEWGPELVQKLHEDSVEEQEKAINKSSSKRPESRKVRRPASRRVAINLDC
jgi:excisionase family DNA binding protein